MKARTDFPHVRPDFPSGARIRGLDNRDQHGPLRGSFRSNAVILNGKLVLSVPWWQNQQGVRECREQGSHGTHAAQRTQVVRHRGALFPDLFDWKAAQAVKLVVRPDDVDASGVVIRCSALVVGSPVQQRFRCFLWFVHGSPDRPNRTVATTVNGCRKPVLAHVVYAHGRKAFTRLRHKTHCRHRNPAQSCPCTSSAIVSHSGQTSTPTSRGDRSE